MWLFTVYGFFSATKLPGKNKTMMIRARSRKHLNRLKEAFPQQLGSLEIKIWKGRDYPYRLLVDVDVWASIVYLMVLETKWDNFKEECSNRFGHHSKYLEALHRIWSIMFQTYLKQRPKLEMPHIDGLSETWGQIHQDLADWPGTQASDDDSIVAGFEDSPEGSQLEDNPSEDERS